MGKTIDAATRPTLTPPGTPCWESKWYWKNLIPFWGGPDATLVFLSVSILVTTLYKESAFKSLWENVGGSLVSNNPIIYIIII